MASENRIAPRGRVGPALACVVIALAALAAYSDSFRAPFIFDDLPNIRDNAAIQHLRSLDVLVPPGQGNTARRPLTNLTFAINYAIGGFDVRSFHAGNLLIHVLAALTLFGIARRTLLNCRLPIADCRMNETATPIAFCIALFWAIHPLQTESVTYIVQRAESLAGLFFLLTLYCFIRAAEADAETRGRGDAEKRHALSLRVFLWEVATIGSCTLGMGAKETMATAPILVLLYDRCFLSGSFREALRRRSGIYLGLAASWAALGAIMLLYKPPVGAGFGLKSATPWQYAVTQGGVILHYLSLSFRPHPLCLDYGWPLARTATGILPGAIIVGGLLAATVWAILRRPALGFLGAWFFLILAPTSSLMPLDDACFEHRMYLPLAAVVSLAVAGAYVLGRRALDLAVAEPRRRRLGTEVAVIFCMLAAAYLGGLTFLRNRVYENAETIWRQVTILRPENPRGFVNFGCALLDEKRREEAIPYFREALRLDPNYAYADINLGVALTGLGRYDEAAGFLARGLSLNPNDVNGRCNFGYALAALGKTPEAIAQYRKAIELRPESAEAHYDLAAALAAEGKDEAAMDEYGETLKLDPGNGQAHNNLARLLALHGRPGEALAHYREALRLMPDSAAVLRNLAWLRATCAEPKFRDAGEALRLARMAFDRSGAGNARALDVLAAACAESGLFDEAVTAARGAIEAAGPAGTNPSAAEIRDRLKLYESHKPYREGGLLFLHKDQ